MEACGRTITALIERWAADGHAAWMLAAMSEELLDAGDTAAARQLAAAIPACLDAQPAGFHRDVAAGMPALVACHDGAVEDGTVEDGGVEHMMAVLQTAADLDAREHLASRAARVLVRRGLVADALGLADTLAAPDRRARVLSAAAEALPEGGTVSPGDAHVFAAALDYR